MDTIIHTLSSIVYQQNNKCFFINKATNSQDAFNEPNTSQQLTVLNKIHLVLVLVVGRDVGRHSTTGKPTTSPRLFDS
jgi:hypothetical protein